MANIVNIVTSGSQSNQVKTEQVSAGAGDQGKTLKIKAQAGSRYQLQDAQSAQPTGPQTLKLKRVGNDLEVTFENGQKADVVIENYFTEITSPNEGLMGQNSSGVMQSYAPVEGSGISSMLNAPDNQMFTSMLFGPAIQGTTAALLPLAGPSLLTVAGITAGAAAVAAGGSGGSDPITPIAPAGANKTITGAEDTAYAIKLADFGFADDNNNTFTAVKITVLPTKGKLTLDDKDVTLNQVITAADITAGKLVFTPATNASGPDYASLEFKVQDNGASNNEATTASKLTFDIAAVNDAPTTSTVVLVAIAEDSGARVITQAQLLGNAADTETNTLTVSNVAITAGKGSLVNNNNGTWSYTPALNDDTSVSFSYTITDNGTTNGAADPKSVAGTATLDITPVNDAPTLTTAGAITTVNEDSANTTAVGLWTTAPVYGQGPADESSQTLSYKITAIPSFIALFKADGTAVLANTTLSATDFAGLKYKTLADANGTGNVTFDVIDSGLAAAPNVNTLLSESVSVTSSVSVSATVTSSVSLTSTAS